MPKIQAARDVFASRLKQARLAVGISQKELGLRVGLNDDVASTRINRYERAVHDADLATAQHLAQELGVPLASLFAHSDELAQLITAFERLPKAKQKAALLAVQQLLGEGHSG